VKSCPFSAVILCAEPGVMIGFVVAMIRYQRGVFGRTVSVVKPRLVADSQ
jgi:hypothetical protein